MIDHPTMQLDDEPEAKRSRLYGYPTPSSARLELGITKNRALQLVGAGMHPRGSIWCPGAFGSHHEHLGDLYGPDPAWRGPSLIGQDKSNIAERAQAARYSAGGMR